jgi:hypothetical protein
LERAVPVRRNAYVTTASVSNSDRAMPTIGGFSNRGNQALIDAQNAA